MQYGSSQKFIGDHDWHTGPDATFFVYKHLLSRKPMHVNGQGRGCRKWCCHLNLPHLNSKSTMSPLNTFPMIIQVIVLLPLSTAYLLPDWQSFVKVLFLETSLMNYAYPTQTLIIMPPLPLSILWAFSPSLSKGFLTLCPVVAMHNIFRSENLNQR